MKGLKTTLLLLSLALLIACGPGLGDEPPLHDAALRGNNKEVLELLDSGIPVDSLNSEGATPLHWAAFKGHEAVAKTLLNYGADVNALTKKGSTPLRLASTHKRKKLIVLLKTRGATE
ncbi:MAG: hypothetical protein COA42_21195 [Alteromonadaceae bacterium]|nr:MAG: hypothetical protein COA42_21195 [Alteromonadaceae bacterium]